MGFHTRRSPSQAKKIKNCPGSLHMVAIMPTEMRRDGGYAARLGTATHFLIEECLREHREPEEFLGRLIKLEGVNDDASLMKPNAKTPRDGFWFEVDADMIDAAELATKYVRKRCKKFGVDESDLQLETRTNPLPDREDTSGSADVGVDAWPSLFELVDFKNGYIHVSEIENYQLRAYLLGKAIEADFAHDKYMVTVIQPASQLKGLAPVRSVTYTAKELKTFQLEYRALIERSEAAERDKLAPKDHNHINPKWSAKWLSASEKGDGESHCMFCDAMAICPAYRAMVAKAAAVDFSEAPPDKMPVVEEDIAKLLPWLPVLDMFSRAVASHALRALEAGNTVPGYKAVRKTSKRIWKNLDESVIVTRAKKFGIPRDKLFTEPKLISGPQAEKLVEAKRRPEFNEALLHKPLGELTIVPDSDKREAVNLDPSQVYKNAPLDDEWTEGYE